MNPLVTLLVAPALVAGACTADVSRPLNTADVERQVAADVGARGDVDVDVSCPADVEAETGAGFTCSATDRRGTSLDVSVVQEDDDGNVDWDLEMLNLPLIESQLSSEVSRSVGVQVEVACPRVLVSSQRGSTLDCHVTDSGGRSGVLRVVVADDDGHVDWELNPGGAP